MGVPSDCNMGATRCFSNAIGLVEFDSPLGCYLVCFGCSDDDMHLSGVIYIGFS